MAPTQKKSQDPPPWRNSEAKALLRELLMDEESWIHLCLLEQIHMSEPLFKQYKWANFRNNFNTLSKAIELEKASVAWDQRAFDKYKKKHPREETTNRGEPFWDGHQAQRLLISDVKKQASDLEKGIIDRPKLPAEMWNTRVEYKEFAIATFRNHYYREKRSLVESVYWQKKRNRDGQRKRQLEEEKNEEDD